MKASAVLEAFQMIMDAKEQARNSMTKMVDWEDTYIFLHDSFHDKFMSVYHYGEPEHTKDLLMLFGEMLSIMQDGKNREVDSKSIIRSVAERIRFLNGGEINVWVNVYEITREYGGAEEGGWYFDWRVLIDSKFCLYEHIGEELKALQEKHGDGEGDISSVLGGYEVDIRVESVRGESRSTVRPHYE